MISLDSSIGIDIKEDRLVMVCVQKSLNGMTLRHHEVIPLPTLAESKEKRERVVINGIDDFIKKVKIKDFKVFLSIPRTEVLLRYLRLPLTAKENLEQVLKYELERYIPFPTEDVYFDFQILKEEEKWLHIFLTVAKKDVIHSYLDMFSLTNLYPSSLEISATALFNAFMNSNEAQEEGAHALIDLRRNYWELGLIMGGILAYSRAFAWKDGDMSYFSQVKKGLQSALFHISNEGPLNTQNAPYEPLRAIILNGIELDQKMVDEFLKQDEIPSSMGLRPIRLKDIPSNFRSLATAYGTALKGLRKVPLRINLIPVDLRRHLKRSSLIPTAVLGALVLFLGLAWGSSVLIKERRLLRKLDAQIEQLEPEVSAVEEMQTQISQLEKKLDILKKIKRESPSQLEILRELTAVIPENTWLNRFVCRRGKVEIEGQAPSASDLIAILERSPLFRDARFPAPITKTSDGLERFKMEATIEGITDERS